MKTQEKRKRSKCLVLKPVSKDVYYKYICTKCGCEHWISHKEACAKNFKIICDCGITIKPKRILDTKIFYAKKKTNTQSVNRVQTKQTKSNNTFTNQTTTPKTKPSVLLDDNVKKECCDILIGYGFEKQEALILIDKSFSICQTNEVTLLVKTALKNIGVKHA